MRRFDYGGSADLLAMQHAVQRTWTPQQRWHVGDLAWGWNSIPEQEQDWRTALWKDGDIVVAWGWVELPGHLDLYVDPAHPGLADEVLAWFEAIATGHERTVTALETEEHLIAALKRAGYRPMTNAPFFQHCVIALDESLRLPHLPDGYRVRAVHEDEAEARAAVHRAAWRPKRIGAMFVPPVDLGEAESSMTTESYRAVMEAWPYRHDLDQVVEAPDGTLAAFALGWLDEVNRAGELEPVGTDPRYAVRRAGIGGEPGLPARVARRWRDTGRCLSTWRRGVPRRPPSLLRARISAGRTNSDIRRLTSLPG